MSIRFLALKHPNEICWPCIWCKRHIPVAQRDTKHFVENVAQQSRDACAIRFFAYKIKRCEGGLPRWWHP